MEERLNKEHGKKNNLTLPRDRIIKHNAAHHSTSLCTREQMHSQQLAAPSPIGSVRKNWRLRQSSASRRKIAPSAHHQDNHSDSLLLIDCRLVLVDNHGSQHPFG